MIIFPLQVNFSELSRKYGAADKTKVGNILVSGTTLKEEGRACLHKLFLRVVDGIVMRKTASVCYHVLTLQKLEY